jgi:nitrite reductase/ring-hydroxylating ferredoxin subunit
MLEPEARPTLRQALRTLAPGRVAAARSGRQPVAAVRLADGRAFVVEDRCPHDGGLLSNGFVDGDRLVCARHGWAFEVCTGRCPDRPDITVASTTVAAALRKLTRFR